jgi:hypothetical protein
MTKIRYWLRTVFLMALIMGLSWFPGAKADLNDGLVAYYPFDGNANDVSGNGNNGVVYGATLTEDRFGNLQNAYSFDGNEHIQFNTPVVQHFPPYSVSLWVKYDAVPDVNAYIISNGGQTGSSQGLSLLVGASQVYCGRSYPMGAVMFVVGNQAYNFRVTLTAGMTSGQWHHVTGTWDGPRMALYIDGQLAQIDVSGWSTGTEFGQPQNMRIGAPSNRLDYFFNGQLDDVRLYNRVLSECEIKTLYTGEDQCTSSPPISSDDCWAIYENGNLHIPCVKVIGPFGDELHYEADMQYEPLSEPMSFQLMGAKPK